ncbi:hypothetical protein Tco_0362441, partial [Tanacetum coccineum]
MADFLAVRALYNAWPMVVKLALIAQWKSSSILFLFTRPNSVSPPSVLSLAFVEVLRYDIKRSKSENKRIVPTEMELVLEQTQQGTSHEVSISTEGVEE